MFTHRHFFVFQPIENSNLVLKRTFLFPPNKMFVWFSCRVCVWAEL